VGQLRPRLHSRPGDRAVPAVPLRAAVLRHRLPRRVHHVFDVGGGDRPADQGRPRVAGHRVRSHQPDGGGRRRLRRHGGRVAQRRGQPGGGNRSGSCGPGPGRGAL
ncbi:MAG: hypothetical protein AVDCRST_MAG10-175, partial [uncultured Acidimicrobiales bacterium]